MQILPYNRVLQDLNGLAPAEHCSSAWRRFLWLNPLPSAQPECAHRVGFYLQGRWKMLQFRPELTGSADPIERLDVTLLQKHVLRPVLRH